ncbi:hypothetical protein [Streptomyces sp. NPDC047028]|uniref:hypothetical protein n=1 Tax=Streptomyces sp. NPDC047028 TaxID=3155793 RepID=UPI0033C219D5
MTSLAAATLWWHDWLKWTPGWLAFAWAVGNGIYLGIRKMLDRRNMLALGTAPDDLRTALITARTRLEDIVAEGRRADWFAAEERRETGRAIKDMIGRRTDETLREHLTGVVAAWTEASARAPGATGPMMRWSDHVTTPQERAESARVQEQFRKETEEARKGLAHITGALMRLDDLERRTHGR